MLVCRQAVFLVPSPTPFPPVLLLLLNLFNMAREIEFASSNFPPSHKTASCAGQSGGIGALGKEVGHLLSTLSSSPPPPPPPFPPPFPSSTRSKS